MGVLWFTASACVGHTCSARKLEDFRGFPHPRLSGYGGVAVGGLDEASRFVSKRRVEGGLVEVSTFVPSCKAVEAGAGVGGRRQVHDAIMGNDAELRRGRQGTSKRDALLQVSEMHEGTGPVAGRLHA